MLSLIGSIILCLCAVIIGAHLLVSGASGVARKTGISEFIIGSVIVGFGTSCPELVVSLSGVIQGSSDIAIGNVFGSNIINIFFILGITLLFSKINITESNKKKDIPWLVSLTTVFLVLYLTGNTISRIEGIILLFLFGQYLFFMLKNPATLEEEQHKEKEVPWYISVIYILGGLALLVFGGNYFVDSSIQLAETIGLDEKVIAVTLLAGGTSLPELVTCLVAARKGKTQMALGDIIGSNIFNLIFILGLSSIIHPLSGNFVKFDVFILAISSFIFGIAYLKGKKNLTLIDGLLFLLITVLYYGKQF